MTRWITRRPDALTEDERQRFKAVLARCPEREAAAAHVGSFATMMTGLQGDQLGGAPSGKATATTPWVTTLTTSAP
ncbi:hypothetical protein AB0J63_37120 [Streptosporangium canum]|uniref:hypothetical protein n=1 Tax=Streptosporangium canum TaxID=324952 RepID=UPI00344231C1